MSEHVAWFGSGAHTVAVALPFELDALLADWAALRVPMARHLPEAFQRDEWAYLISFLEDANLRGAFVQAFGAPTSAGDAKRLVRPAGDVAVWLPNNVSLLGPLVLILLSITGNALRLKGGSRSADLTGAFLDFAREHARAGVLRDLLADSVRFEVFDREDARNAEWAATARSRIVFGSDGAADAIESLPHPAASTGFAFTDRRSEAWIEPALLTDERVDTLIKVFAIYGQAGCTSPRRVVLVGGDDADARALRDRMLARWEGVRKGRAAANVASANVMARQWAAALGWDAVLCPDHAAVLATGAPELEPFDAPMGLPIVAASIERTLETLPSNLQTIGHVLRDPSSPAWLERVARCGAKRFVPLGRMHHFGPVWDGVDFWRQTFEEIEVDA